MEDKQWIPRGLRKIVSSAYKTYAPAAFSKFDALISVTPHIVRPLKEINSEVYMVTNYPILSPVDKSDNKETGLFKLCFA